MTDPSIFNIDITRLDDEWLTQPGKAHDAIERYRIAGKKLREGKAEFEKITAGIRLNIRQCPSDYDLPAKITEKMVDEALLIAPKFQKAQAKYFILQDKSDRRKNVVQVMDDRKKALENLVRLHGQDYFSTPRVDSGYQSTVDDMKQRAMSGKTKRKKK